MNRPPRPIRRCPSGNPSRRPSRARTGAAAAAALLLAAACASNEPAIEPIPRKEIEQLEALRRHDPKAGYLDDKGTLFVALDQNLRKWRELGARTDLVDVDQKHSLEIVLTQQVYYNFDTILNELALGTDPDHKVTAAAAIGFSRIPAPDEPGGDPEFPALHPRAVQPLLAVIETGHDELVINALLSLGRIAAPETPRALVIELMLKHHHADVRANAALALAQMARPADAPLLLGPLFAALGDAHPTVRLHAVRALGSLGDRTALGPLVDRLRNDPTPLVRACAAMELGRLGDWGTVGYLIDALDSEAPLLAFQCHQALVRLTNRRDLHGTREWREWWIKAPENPERRRG